MFVNRTRHLAPLQGLGLGVNTFRLTHIVNLNNPQGTVDVLVSRL